LKKLGGFRIFWSVHQNWKVVYVLLLVHGPNVWIWFLWPLVLFVCDRLVSRERRQQHVVLQRAELLEGNVMKLVFNVPNGFVYQAGQYVQLCCEQVNPEEWHPFTLTSCPEEDFISVHIRCPDELDWCSDLRRKLVELPTEYLTNGKQKHGPGYQVMYKPHYEKNENSAAAFDANEGQYVAKPVSVEPVGKAGKRDEWNERAKSQGKISSWARSFALTGTDVDPEAVSVDDVMKPALLSHGVRMRLDGPHGAPSELVWKHSVVMLVGAGIGVTPFASILRSIQLRHRPEKRNDKNAPIRST